MISSRSWLPKSTLKMIVSVLAVLILVFPNQGALSFAGQTAIQPASASQAQPVETDAFNALPTPGPSPTAAVYAPTPTSIRTIDITQGALTAVTHVVDQYPSPWSGNQEFEIPPMSSGLSVKGDGLALAYSIIPGRDTPNQVIGVEVPAGVAVLTLEYDQLDGTLAFEGAWYLTFDWVWGPVTLNIHLPADANLIRYENSSLATLVNPYTLCFDVPAGTPVATTIVYQTTPVPDLYYQATTAHFNLHLPLIYALYEPALASTLEALYLRYGGYLGYDLNTYTGHAHFEYYFPPGGWNWWGTTITLWGGLCIVGGGPCAVNRSVIPRMTLLPNTTYWDIPFGYLGHELGHGWQGVIAQGSLPWWMSDGEGYPSFLNSQAWTDLGLCPAVETGYSQAYGHYQEYLADNTTRHDFANIVILSSLRKAYGWDWLRAVHQAILAGSLNLNGLSDAQKNDRMIVFLSQFLQQNLVDFFDLSAIHASQTARNVLAGLPNSSASIPTSWSCPAGTLGASVASLSLVVDAAGPALPLRGFYVRNTGDGQIQWHVAASPPVDWLSISTETGVATGLYSPPVAITIDAASLAAGVYTTTLSISGQAGSLNSPLAIPVTLWVGPAENTHLPMLFK